MVTKVCRKCGMELPATTEFFTTHKLGKYGLNPSCRKCERERNRKWRAANSQKERERHRQYYEANTAKMRDLVRRWWEAHPDYSQEYYQANAEKKREQRRANSDRANANTQRRRALKAQNGGTYTDADIKAKYQLQQGRCYYCACGLDKKYHIEHMTPISRGGTNWPDNIVLACATCNCQKHNKTVEEFMGSNWVSPTETKSPE